MKLAISLFLFLCGLVQASADQTNEVSNIFHPWSNARERSDADHREGALKAASRLVPEMAKEEVMNLFGSPHMTVSRPGRSIFVYRIAENYFLHLTLTDEKKLMGADLRTYSIDSGRLSSSIITGHVERVESPDLVFADWITTTNQYVVGHKRRGVGKHVELLLNKMQRNHLIQLLGNPDKVNENTGSIHYYFERHSRMSIDFDQSDCVVRVTHSGR